MKNIGEKMEGRLPDVVITVQEKIEHVKLTGDYEEPHAFTKNKLPEFDKTTGERIHDDPPRSVKPKISVEAMKEALRNIGETTQETTAEPHDKTIGEKKKLKKNLRFESMSTRARTR